MKFAKAHAALPIAVALLAGVPLLSGHVRAAPDKSADEKAPGDLKSLEGAWNVDAMEWGRGSLPKELMEGYKFVFAGNKLTWQAAIGMTSRNGKIFASDGTFPCDFKIDPSKKPKEIDITLHLKQGDRTVLGIYEIKGDALKVCFFDSKSGRRPTEFATKEGLNIGLITLTRAKK
jgi:uncharacterized protein (TIGR03067 family)